jgi:ribosomal protein S27AE
MSLTVRSPEPFQYGFEVVRRECPKCQWNGSSGDWDGPHYDWQWRHHADFDLIEVSCGNCYYSYWMRTADAVTPLQSDASGA